MSITLVQKLQVRCSAIAGRQAQKDKHQLKTDFSTAVSTGDLELARRLLALPNLDLNLESALITAINRTDSAMVSLLASDHRLAQDLRLIIYKALDTASDEILTVLLANYDLQARYLSLVRRIIVKAEAKVAILVSLDQFTPEMAKYGLNVALNHNKIQAAKSLLDSGKVDSIALKSAIRGVERRIRLLAKLPESRRHDYSPLLTLLKSYLQL